MLAILMERWRKDWIVLVYILLGGIIKQISKQAYVLPIIGSKKTMIHYESNNIINFINIKTFNRYINKKYIYGRKKI